MGGLERSGEQPGLRTHWGHVQDLNLAITYRVTNNSNFRMDGEAMLTGASLVHAGVFYAEVRGGQYLRGPGVKLEPRRDKPPSRPG